MIASRIILFYLSVRVVCCIPLNQFYPYGPYAAEATSKIDKGNNAFSPVIFTQKSFYFFGQQCQSVIVSVNGALSFYKTAPEFTSDPFPLGNNRIMIAPFWADIDTSRRGNVWYHESSDPNFLKRASDVISKVYPETNYAAENLFIVTWEKVGYYNAATTKTNTFQCVLATDGKESYAVFLYADKELQWTTGDADGGINGLGGIPAQVGFNKGDSIGFTTINNSRTEHIIKIASASNIGLTGILVFKISDENISIRNLTFTSDDNNDDDDEFYATHNAEYYLSFFMNYDDDGSASISIITTDSQPVSYFIEAPGIGFHHNGTITADNPATIQLPSAAIVTSHVQQNKGIYLKASSDSVTVIGRNLHPAQTVDTFLALPIVKLSVSMYVYFGITVPRNVHMQNVVLVVGTEDNTIMKLIVTQPVTISVGSTTTNLIPGNEYSFVINRLQTVFFESDEDLSGTKIVTNKPVSVHSGHECATIPDISGTCDYLIEQMPPTAFWGRVHYVAPLASRQSYSIKIVATHDSTNIDVYCNSLLKSSHSVDEGKYINITLNIQEYCAVISSKEVLIFQFGHRPGFGDVGGDPLMIILSPTNQYNYKLRFSTLLNPIIPGYRHYINIIVLAQYFQPDEMYMITGGVSTSLNTQTWIQVKVNNSIEAYATSVNVPEGVVEVTHNNKAALMTTVVYGFTTHESYGHAGGYAHRIKISGPPPYFTMSPSNQTVELSTNSHNITLSCKANNTLSYIWDRQNGGIPSGAIGRNTDTLILINVQPKDSGSYRCVATNNYGTNMSDYATVIIKSEPCEVTSITGEVRVDGNVVTITFSTSNSAAEFQCKLDSEMLSPCSSPNTWTNVNSGEHSITVVARCPGQKETMEKTFKFEIP